MPVMTVFKGTNKMPVYHCFPGLLAVCIWVAPPGCTAFEVVNNSLKQNVKLSYTPYSLSVVMSSSCSGMLLLLLFS